MIQILLSTYNGAAYISEQLDSILAQTYTDWRLLIRDDGSTDNTPAILATYAAKDQRITLLAEHHNIGACRSFMNLLELCPRADYYAFSDQDDIWHPNKLQLQLSSISSAENDHPQCPIIVHTDLREINQQGQEIHPSFWQASNIRPQLLDTQLHYLAICNSVTGCAMLFNHAAREVSLPMPENAFMHDAWIGIATLLHQGYIIPIPQATVDYRQHAHNVVGAVDYHFTLLDWKNKYQLAKRSYSSAHPQVWKNILHFLWWKSLYFIALHK